MLNGKRDGKGIVYTTDTNSCPFLFECQWLQGTPKKGRYTVIYNSNVWRKRDGETLEYYGLTGIGTQFDEDGSGYHGGYVNASKQGKGRWTLANGDYNEGEWKDDEPVGEHKYYNK